MKKLMLLALLSATCVSLRAMYDDERNKTEITKILNAQNRDVITSNALEPLGFSVLCTLVPYNSWRYRYSWRRHYTEEAADDVKQIWPLVQDILINIKIKLYNETSYAFECSKIADAFEHNPDVICALHSRYCKKCVSQVTESESDLHTTKRKNKKPKQEAMFARSTWLAGAFGASIGVGFALGLLACKLR